MNITCFGDSLTLGMPGSCYVGLLREKCKGHTIVKLGFGGETVKNLLQRIGGKSSLPKGDIAVLSIGMNDVFVKISPQYPLLQILTRQQSAKNHTQFADSYARLIDLLAAGFSHVICVSVTLLGEDPSNTYNREIDQLNRIITTLCAERTGAHYLDIKQKMIDYCAGRTISSFLPVNARRVLLDGLLLKNDRTITRTSRKRGLQVTLDGVHLNPTGALIWANAVFDMVTSLAAGNNPEIDQKAGETTMPAKDRVRR